MKNKANVLIIGAQKAGTTSLCNYLAQHPDIYFSEIKEVNYFVRDEFYQKGEDYYHSFFPNHHKQKVIASADVHLLPCAKAPERVFNYNPEMKMIVLLRDPVKRAYSAYNYAIQKCWGDEKIDFLQTMALEEKRIEAENYQLMYFYNGLYNKHLNNWLKYFPRNNFFIATIDDLKNDSPGLLKKIFNFLEIPEKDVDFSQKANETGGVKSRFIQKYFINRDSSLTKQFGKILSQKQKVLIRSKIMPLLVKLNYKNKKIDELSKEQYQLVYPYFENDLLELEKNFQIKF